MNANNTAETIESSLRRVVEERMGVARDLASSAERRTSAAAALEVADVAYADAYANAVGAGWTPAELRKAGLDEATRRPTRRTAPRASTPRRASAARATSAPVEQTPAAPTGDEVQGETD